VVHCGSLFVFFLLIIVLSVFQFADGFWLPFCNFKLFYITARTNYISKRWLPHGTRPISLALFFYFASSLKQQSTGKHVAPIGHIILIPMLTGPQNNK
jgi:hypothetical protein